MPSVARFVGWANAGGNEL